MSTERNDPALAASETDEVQARVAEWVKDQAHLQASDSTPEGSAEESADDAGREQEREAKLETVREAAARFAAECLGTLKGKAELPNDVLLSAAKAQGADLVHKWMAQTNFWKRHIEETDSVTEKATKMLEDELETLRKVKEECRMVRAPGSAEALQAAATRLVGQFLNPIKEQPDLSNEEVLAAAEEKLAGLLRTFIWSDLEAQDDLDSATSALERVKTARETMRKELQAAKNARSELLRKLDEKTQK
ncbi:hypothetical protein AURDEDRAFT_177763 [Auricularia subglabra TFB-10046 SS5]|uniref:Uncharacterized protein n=1 Tax=Auricularia subglabra (strain TFB-10046 / SS5) TaxID=717982 RepID=J0WMV4_AURST|nr:hypothetical protein AURDEDRAFT_177763 [Auricularia subglabra TFB-10046 SS5]